MFSKHSQSLKVLMMLTVSMTVSHLYQNLETLKVSEALNRLLKVLIIAINAQSHSVDAPLGLGGGDHLYPYGKKLIGSLVPVHSTPTFVGTKTNRREDCYPFCKPKEKITRAFRQAKS